MSTPRKLAYLAAAEAFQWLPAPLVRRAQLIKLRRMLRFAETHVPFYAESFSRAGVRAKDLRRLEDLAQFPTVTRERVIGAYPDRIRYREPSAEDVVFRTSGTSGQFMEIAYDAAANDYLDAVYARALFQTGYRPWHKLAYFWGEARRQTRLYERFGLMRKSYIRLDPDPRVQFAELLLVKPDWIYVFPSAMDLLARLASESGTGVLSPKGVICHGELLLAETRARIASTFHCPVFNLYGAQEFNRMAWDCDLHGPLHMDADSVYIEVLRGDRVVDVGQEGELVVTGLINRLMPLVRYRVGDAGRLVPGTCPCGRGLPRLEITEGRLDDVLLFDNGMRLGPRSLAPRIEALDGFTQYRLLQKSGNHVEVQAVWREPANTVAQERLRRVVQDLLGPEIQVDLTSVPRISLGRRGKLQKIVREHGGKDPK